MTNYMNRVVDLKKLDQEIENIRAERERLKREQGRLRVQEHRLKKLRASVVGSQEDLKL